MRDSTGNITSFNTTIFQTGKGTILLGAGDFNETGLLTLTTPLDYTTYPLEYNAYFAASNSLAAGVYPVTILSSTTVQITTPDITTTSGAYASTTSEVVLLNAILPANTLSTNGRVSIDYFFGVKDSTVAKNLKIRFGSEQISDIILNSTGAKGYSGRSWIVNADSYTTQTCRTQGAGSQGIGSMTALPKKTFVNTTEDVIISISAQIAATTQHIAIESISIEANSPKMR